MNVLLCLQAGEILAWGFVSEPGNPCLLVGGVLTGCSQFDHTHKKEDPPSPHLCQKPTVNAEISWKYLACSFSVELFMHC